MNATATAIATAPVFVEVRVIKNDEILFEGSCSSGQANLDVGFPLPSLEVWGVDEAGEFWPLVWESDDNEEFLSHHSPARVKGGGELTWNSPEGEVALYVAVPPTPADDSVEEFPFEPAVLAWQRLTLNTQSLDGKEVTYIGQGWHRAAGAPFLDTFPNAKPLDLTNEFSHSAYTVEGGEVHYFYFLNDGEIHAPEPMVAAVAMDSETLDAWEQEEI